MMFISRIMRLYERVLPNIRMWTIGIIYNNLKFANVLRTMVGKKKLNEKRAYFDISLGNAISYDSKRIVKFFLKKIYHFIINNNLSPLFGGRNSKVMTFLRKVSIYKLNSDSVYVMENAEELSSRAAYIYKLLSED